MQFTVKTDHKPLVTLFKPTSKPPPRIERWVTQLMPYNFTVMYQPGSENGADFLSRSNPFIEGKYQHNGDEYINTILNNSLPKAIPLKVLQAETAKDNTLQKLKSYIDKGTFNKTDKTLQPYFAIRNNISTFNNLVMFNEKIIITVQRLRRTVWWPKLKYQVEHFIKNCHDCQVVGPLPPPTPLKMTDIPEGSWLLVGCDLCGPFPTGESLLVCIDYYSRYPEVDILHKTKASVITSKLRKLFCRYGAPETLVTDNGPQFKNNSEFKALMTAFDIHHRRVTPYRPIANGEVERFNRNLKKCIQTSISKGIDWRISLQNFLLNYRNTIHSTTGVTPAELLFERPLRDKLPSPSQRITDKNQLNQASVSKDIASKAAIKSYADTKRKASEHHIKIGQQVLITNNSPHRNKYTTKWDKTPRTG